MPALGVTKMTRFSLICPRCKRWSEVESATVPHVNCGDCLMNDVEIVELVKRQVVSQRPIHT